MTTAREVIALALKEAGVLGVGQTALAEDINDGFTYLKNMLAQWQKRRWLVPALQDISMPGNDEKSNTIGPGGYWDIQRPVDVKAGWFVQLGTGGSSPVSFPLRKIFSYEDYARIALKELNSFPNAFYYDGQWPKGHIFIYPIPSDTYEIHLLVEKQLAFTGIGDGSITTAGTLYTAGAYNDVPLIGGDGSGGEGATANIVIAGGAITNFQIVLPGQNYVVGNTITIDNDDVGGTGTGFVWTINSLNNNLDYEFELPDEYMEAIHYNLAIRFISAYQVQNPSPQTGVLAKVALNTIKRANTQISTLKMPSFLRGKSFGYTLYDPDNYSGLV